MTSFTTFYLSRVIGKKVYDTNDNYVGVVKDLYIEPQYSSERPIVNGIKLKVHNDLVVYSYEFFKIEKIESEIKVVCTQLHELPYDEVDDNLQLVESVLDKQIVDLNGRKVVRVNDVRLVSLDKGTYVVAVDVGLEGKLRRIGIARPVKNLYKMFGKTLSSKFILWDDVEALDYNNLNIKLSKTYSKLHRLHPSDLADIIEDLGKASMAKVISSLDEEHAADVLEELEPQVQAQLIKSLPVAKAADIIEKMPANEAADLIDVLESDKAEELLKEMDAESSEEVRELLEYEDETVGSIMTTEFLSFKENMPVFEVLTVIRLQKPEEDALYNLFVTDEEDHLLATISLRDLIISEPAMLVGQIMRKNPIAVYDKDKIHDLAELISKYNLLSIPVIDEDRILLGMVVIDDIVEDLIKKGRTNR